MYHVLCPDLFDLTPTCFGDSPPPCSPCSPPLPCQVMNERAYGRKADVWSPLAPFRSSQGGGDLDPFKGWMKHAQTAAISLYIMNHDAI